MESSQGSILEFIEEINPKAQLAQPSVKVQQAQPKLPLSKRSYYDEPPEHMKRQIELARMLMK